MDCLQVTEHRKGLDEILTASGRNFDGNVGWVSCSGRRKLGTDWAFGTGQRNLVTERLRTWYRIMKFGYRQTQNLAQDNKIWVPTDSEFGTGQWNLGTDSAFGTGQRNLGTDRLSIWHRTTKITEAMKSEINLNDVSEFSSYLYKKKSTHCKDQSVKTAYCEDLTETHTRSAWAKRRVTEC